MKLNIFGIRDSCTGSMGHRQAITSSTYWISSIAIDTAQTAGGKNRCVCKVAVHSLLITIEHVAAVTGNCPIIIEWIARVMRKRDQVDCSDICFNPYVGTLLDRFDKTSNDRLARGVTNVKDPSTRVRCLLSPDRIAFLIMIEDNLSRSFEYFIE